VRQAHCYRLCELFCATSADAFVMIACAPFKGTQAL
jgi:hypothetical protein